MDVEQELDIKLTPFLGCHAVNAGLAANNCSYIVLNSEYNFRFWNVVGDVFFFAFECVFRDSPEYAIIKVKIRPGDVYHTWLDYKTTDLSFLTGWQPIEELSHYPQALGNAKSFVQFQDSDEGVVISLRA